MKWRYAQHLYHSLGELWLIKGDAVQALRCAEACLELALATTSRKIWSRVATAGAGILPSEATAGSEAAAVEGSHDRQEIGNPPQLWQTYQALGEFFEQLGQRDQARSAYTSAPR